MLRALKERVPHPDKTIHFYFGVQIGKNRQLSKHIFFEEMRQPEINLVIFREEIKYRNTEAKIGQNNVASMWQRFLFLNLRPS